MNRYLDANEDLTTIFYKVLGKNFPALSNIKFKLLFDTKKRIKSGKLVMASIELTNEKIKYFSSDNDTPEGYDYIIFVDSVVWEYAKEDDKERLISHELNHVFIDEKGKYKIINHDIEDFLVEIKKNADKPNWAAELGFLAMSVYAQDEEDKN